ncbi:polyprenol phosphomannose-dependent alpha 1,6 mannosyltransferase MptB [Embleya sp. NPDC001921]
MEPPHSGFSLRDDPPSSRERTRMSRVGALRLWGATGTLAMAVGGFGSGSLPAHDAWGLWVPRSGEVALAAEIVAYVGLAILVVTWGVYGRLLARGESTSARETVKTLVWWIVPLALAPPLYSADAYSYIAQGAMVLEGLDVYVHGPSVLPLDSPGADAAASVGPRWVETPAPYGPAFLLLAKVLVGLTNGAIVPTVLGMRLVSMVALGLIVWAVRQLANEYDAPACRTLWLAALNPLTVMHVVGGVHNDGLMIALMLAGIVLTLRGRWVCGSGLVGFAMMVKTPAAVALLFVVVIVAQGARGSRFRRMATGIVGPGTIALVVVMATTILSGTGFGWLRTQGVAATIYTPLSATSSIGLSVGHLAQASVGFDPATAMRAVQTLGLVAMVTAIAVLVVGTLTRRLPPMVGHGLSLLALVAFSPMVQPWYLLWGICAVAAAVGWNDRIGRTLIILSAGLAFEGRPSGATPPWVAGFVLVAAIAAYLMSSPARVGPRYVAPAPAPARVS